MQSYLHFTAYTIISASSVKGTCVRSTGSPIPVPAAYIVYVQSEYPGPFWNITTSTLLVNEYSANFSTSLANAYSSLKTEIGQEPCATTAPTSIVLPLGFPSYMYQVASATALPSAAALSSTTVVSSATSIVTAVHDRHVRTKKTIIVSIVVPLAVLIGVFLCFIGIVRHRKRKPSQADGKDQRSEADGKDKRSLTSHSQIYVDRKAELEDEQRRRHELDASGVSYEVDGEDRIFEMSTGDRDLGTRSVSMREMQELTGVEHWQELEVPINAT